MSRTKKMHNNKLVHHHLRDHEDQSQHINYHVTIIQPNIKRIEIINLKIKYNEFVQVCKKYL